MNIFAPRRINIKGLIESLVEWKQEQPVSNHNNAIEDAIKLGFGRQQGHSTAARELVRENSNYYVIAPSMPMIRGGIYGKVEQLISTNKATNKVMPLEGFESLIEDTDQKGISKGIWVNRVIIIDCWSYIAHGQGQYYDRLVYVMNKIKEFSNNTATFVLLD